MIVEVDGNQHGYEATQRRDAARTVLLEAEGYRVLRFWNEDIWHHLEMVLDTIFAAVVEGIGTSET